MLRRISILPALRCVRDQLGAERIGRITSWASFEGITPSATVPARTCAPKRSLYTSQALWRRWLRSRPANASWAAWQHRSITTNAVAVTEASESESSPRILRPNPPPESPDGSGVLTIRMDASAVEQLHAIYAKSDAANEEHEALRITVEAGGCHGFQYKLDLQPLGRNLEHASEEDVVMERDGAYVVVDTTSLELISGARIIFADELIGRAFQIVDIPNAGSNCGCGTSFEIKI